MVACCVCWSSHIIYHGHLTCLSSFLSPKHLSLINADSVCWQKLHGVLYHSKPHSTYCHYAMHCAREYHTQREGIPNNSEEAAGDKQSELYTKALTPPPPAAALDVILCSWPIYPPSLAQYTTTKAPGIKVREQKLQDKKPVFRVNNETLMSIAGDPGGPQLSLFRRCHWQKGREREERERERGGREGGMGRGEMGRILKNTRPQ